MAAAATVGLLLVGKLKFLLLGLTKLSTFASMFGFIAVYWSIHGWPLAVGLAGSIYIHEMGHVAMLRRLGIHGGRAAVHSRRRGARDAQGAGHRPDRGRPHRSRRSSVGTRRGGRLMVDLYGTGAPIWQAITELTGFLNLFNLIPIWQLDGSRGFHALSRHERWIVPAAIAAAIWSPALAFCGSSPPLQLVPHTAGRSGARPRADTAHIRRPRTRPSRGSPGTSSRERDHVTHARH